MIKRSITTPGAAANGTLPLALLLLLSTPTAALARPSLSAAQLKQLEAWQIVVSSWNVKGSSVNGGEAIGTVAAPPEAVFYALLDLASYKHFLPAVKGSRVVRKKKGRIDAVIETKLPWPMRDAWAYFRLDYRSQPQRTYEARWSLLNGNMRRYQGNARIEPWTDDAHHTIVTFRLLVEPKTAVPNSALSKGARRVAGLFLHRLRMRVKALRKYNKLPSDLRTRYRATR